MLTSLPSLEAVQALNGRLYVLLKPAEVEVLDFYVKQGRKFDVTVSIEKRVGAAELSAAASPQHAQDLLAKADTVVRVEVGAGAQTAWAQRAGLAT